MMADSDQIEPSLTQAELGLEIPPPALEDQKAWENLRRQELLGTLRSVFVGFNVVRYISKKYHDQPIDLEKDLAQNRATDTQQNLTRDLENLKMTNESIGQIFQGGKDAKDHSDKLNELNEHYRSLMSLNLKKDAEDEESYDTQNLFQNLSLAELQDIGERLHTPLHDIRTPMTVINGRFGLAVRGLLRSTKGESERYQDFARELKRLNSPLTTLYQFFVDNLDGFVQEMAKPKLEISLKEMTDQIEYEVSPIFEVFGIKDYKVISEVPEDISREQVLVKCNLNLYARTSREVANNVGKTLDERHALQPDAPEKQSKVIVRLSPNQQFIEVVFKANGMPYPKKFAFNPKDPEHTGNFLKGQHGRQTELTGVTGSGMAMYEHQQELRKLGGDIIPLNPSEGGSETVISLPLIGWQHRLPMP